MTDTADKLAEAERDITDAQEVLTETQGAVKEAQESFRDAEIELENAESALNRATRDFEIAQRSFDAAQDAFDSAYADSIPAALDLARAEAAAGKDGVVTQAADSRLEAARCEATALAAFADDLANAFLHANYRLGIARHACTMANQDAAYARRSADLAIDSANRAAARVTAITFAARAEMFKS